VRPRAKVTINSPYEVAYMESIGTKMNESLMSCQPIVSHASLNMSETVRNRGLVRKDHQ